MKIWGISDLHLSFSTNKPMDIFGEHWKNHADIMAKNWDAKVEQDDIVLCPGDLSWAMRLDEAKPDLDWIGERKGQKILGKGNHDFWWSAISKVRAALPESCRALQNDAVDLGDVILAGSRCWVAPGGYDYKPADEKIYLREIERLKLSLNAAKKLQKESVDKNCIKKNIIAMIHYPPFVKDNEEESGFRSTEISDLLEEFGVIKCVYGHLHGKYAHDTAFTGTRSGIEYGLIACDYINFNPVLIYEK